MPAIEIKPPFSFGPLDTALRDLEGYDWVVLTSVNGVKSISIRMAELGIPIEKLSSRKLAAIGPATAAELERVARKPDLVPAEYVSEAIAEAIRELSSAGFQPAVGAPAVHGPQRFLLARADIARRDLAHLLRAEGAEVDEIAAYRIVRGKGSADLPDQAPDYITLTSSSAARNAYEMLKEKGLEGWMTSSALVCIGPITSRAVRELGFEVAAEATEYTSAGLIKALTSHAQDFARTHA